MSRVFSGLSLDGFSYPSFLQGKGCSETCLELFLLSEYHPSPATLIFPGLLAEIVALISLLRLETSPEMENL